MLIFGGSLAQITTLGLRTVENESEFNQKFPPVAGQSTPVGPGAQRTKSETMTVNTESLNVLRTEAQAIPDEALEELTRLIKSFKQTEDSTTAASHLEAFFERYPSALHTLVVFGGHLVARTPSR